METRAGTPGVVEATFRAMGTDAHVVVQHGPSGLTEHARRRIEELEQRWSRFRPDSELCRINRSLGDPVVVHPLTFELLVAARDAWTRTGGAFDPTVLPALVAAGYDRDFAAMAPDSRSGDGSTPPADRARAQGCTGVELDRLVGAVRLPVGVELDLGGIAKGFAADVVTLELIEAGAVGACVNLGGDLRVAGEGPGDAGAWIVGVERELGSAGGHSTGGPVAFGLAAGGVATTSITRRTWRRDGEPRHHIIDPRTGRPATTPWAAVTVVAGTASAAEPVAKAVLLTPALRDAETVVQHHGIAALVVAADGTRHLLGSMADFLASVDDLAFSLRSPGLHLPSALVPCGSSSAHHRPRA